MPALALAAAFVLAAPVSASADTVDPNWWFQGLGVDEAHAAGWTGEGVTVAVIENAFDGDLEVLRDADITQESVCGPDLELSADDRGEHGANIAAILAGNGQGPGNVQGIAPDAKLLVYTTACIAEGDRSPVGDAIVRATEAGADIISVSQGAAPLNDTALAADADAIADALAQGAVILAAVPNTRGEDGNGSVPWSYNGVISVNALDPDGQLQRDSEFPDEANIWPETTVIAPGGYFANVDPEAAAPYSSGASNATPVAAGILALTLQKYPASTGPQLIQALIHNTTPDDHELTYDEAGGMGYGPVSLRHMLREDPAGFADENPLTDKSLGIPTAAQIAGSAAPTVEPTASSSPSGEVAESDPMAWLGPVLWIGIGVLVLLAVVTVVIVVVINKRSKNQVSGGAQ